MIIDSSALIAILRQEPEAERLIRAIALASCAYIPSPNYLETTMVLAARSGVESVELLELFLQEFHIQLAPFTPAHARIAYDAFCRFGKGTHPAALNYGDCMAYALAKELRMPLLFKGKDFCHTDILAAEY